MSVARDDALHAFYDGLGPIYDLILGDWEGSVAAQGPLLEALMAQHLGTGRRRVIDATCGIGTQALGLAARGHDVLGTDLSPTLLARAAEEAARRGLVLRTREADLRTLTDAVSERFEVAVVFDNSFAHLLAQPDLERALVQLASVLAPGGLLLTSVRDYDALRAERPRFTSERVVGAGDTRRVALQVWDWTADGTHYDMTQYVLRHGAEGVATQAHRCRLRALGRGDLEAAVAAAGLVEATWLEPEATGFYQPILTARRA